MRRGRQDLAGRVCAGLSYDLRFDADKKVEDIIVEKDGVRLLVDLKE